MYDKATDINDPKSGTPWIPLNSNGLEYRVTSKGWQSRPVKPLSRKAVIALGTFWTVFTLTFAVIIILN